jgi:hypothetical protein
LLVAVGLSPARAADLHQIDRSMKDEPKYNTAEPRYCLLAFGPEARTTIWLVRDGDVLHVYASPDGKSAKAWRQVLLNGVFEIGDVWEDENTCHKKLRWAPNNRRSPVTVLIGGKRQMAGTDRHGKLEFAATAKAAPVIHFNGPLTMDLYREQEPFLAGATNEMAAVVGTPGIGPGTFALVFCDSYPPKAWPEAVIEFPTRYGGKPVVETVRLDDE